MTTFIPNHGDKPAHVHLDQPLVQIGWWGQTGRIYSLDEDPTKTEPGSFAPIWAGWGEECGHQILPDVPDDTPGWEGRLGPGPGQYGKPHVYARSVQSGSGNCVCGQHLGHRLHVQAAPGVDVPARLRSMPEAFRTPAPFGDPNA